MKKLLLIASLALIASCDRNCDEARDQIHKEYLEALQGATTPEAQQELTREYNNRLNQLDC